jgi:hypothetical protein
MAATDIVGEGQRFLGENPQIVKIKRVTLGFSGADVNTGAVQATYPIINVPAGAFVLDVWANVDTAWTASVTITLGDGTSAAGYLDSTEIAPQTAVSTGLFKRSSLQANAFSGGKYYAAADTIDAVVAGANPAVGELEVYVVYVENLDVL